MTYTLPKTVLGRTGLVVTRLGTGGAYTKSPDDYRQALECGVTYMDTARSYGEDEALLAPAIAGRRDRLILASKTAQRDAAGARQDLETSLRTLGIDYLDIWQIHYLNTQPELDRVLGPGGAYEAAVKAREQGLIRFIGVTGHVWEQVAAAVATGLFDTVLCWYNCAMPDPETLLFPVAQAHGTAVIVMQATRIDKLLGGPDQPDLPLFYRYVLAHPAVNVVLRGMRDAALFRQAAQGLSERVSITPEEKAQLEEYGRRMKEAGKLES